MMNADIQHRCHGGNIRFFGFGKVGNNNDAVSIWSTVKSC